MKSRIKIKKTESSAPGRSQVIHLTTEERAAAGKALRKRVPRSSHATWLCPPNRPDPTELLRKSDKGRLLELLPIRYNRMKQSPFAFFRGAGVLMAADLATTPRTEIRVQACGDCHVSNFGGFGSPERQLVFDINDFDETLHAPWEWDVKRLATSIVLVDRQTGKQRDGRSAALRVAMKSYRVHMRKYAAMCALDVWYSELNADILIKNGKTAAAKKYWKQIEDNAKLQTAEHIFPRITNVVKGRPRIIDNPPLVYHPQRRLKLERQVKEMFRRYRLTLPEERRVIMDRYHVVDIARKVVGNAMRNYFVDGERARPAVPSI